MSISRSSAEYRESLRASARIDVDLYRVGHIYADRFLGRFHTRDVGLYGAFIVGAQNDCRPGDLLQLLLSCQAERLHWCRVEAMVSRVDSLGVGVEFVNPTRELHTAVTRLIAQLA